MVTYDKDRASILQGDSWVFTDSLNLAEVLGTERKVIVTKIKDVLKFYKLSSENHIPEIYEIAYYVNSQNKKQPYYKMSKWFTIEVLKKCNRKNSYLAKKELERIGVYDVRDLPKIISENMFYNILTGLFPKLKIHRQHKVENCFVDFYIEDIKLFVEFDEDYHKNKLQNNADKIREIKILNYNDNSIIRVDKNDIYDGLRKIILIVSDTLGLNNAI